MKLFPGDVNHLVYEQNYQNAKDHQLKPIVSKHLELVSFVHRFFPNAMPDILRQHEIYQEQITKGKNILEQIYPKNKVIAYKKCHELILAPKKSQGYFLIQEQKNKENEFLPIQNILP